MKNKLFMTFGGAVAAMCPWLARAETFPTDGTMLENKIYESAATYDNLGVYDGAVIALAEFTDTLYNAAAGSYLPAASEDVTTCPTGYYCPGLSNAKYSETNNQGLNTCPNGYANSDAGARANTQCYTPCTDVSAFAHATAVAGNDYYGAGVDTCYATECVSGYHVNGGIEVAESDPLIDVDPNVSANSGGYINADGYKDNESEFGLTENGTWGVAYSYGTVYGQASCQPATPESQAMEYYSRVMNRPGNYTADAVRSELLSRVDESKANAVADVFAEYKAGTKTEDDATKAAWAILGSEHDANFSKTDSGTVCYCQMTSYTDTNGNSMSVTSAPWVFMQDTLAEDRCAGGCSDICVSYMWPDNAKGRAYRAAVYGSLGTRTVGVCAANEISITWDGADQTDIDANNAGTTTYDGDIRTPVKAQSVPGKIFKGWRFNKNQ